MIDQLIIAARLLAASQVLLTGLALVNVELPVRLKWASCLLALCVVCYLLEPAVANLLSASVAHFIVLPANLVPAIIFVIAWWMFVDDRPVPMWAWITMVWYLVAFTVWQQTTTGAQAGVYLWIAIASQLGKLILVSACLWLVWRDRNDDLISTRQRFRFYFCGAVGLAVALVVGAELFSLWRVPRAIELLGMVAIFSLGLAANLWLMRMPSIDWRRPMLVPEVSQEEKSLVLQIEKLMVDERFYAKEEVRVASMADVLGIPEYRLRRVINSGMGWKNFNQFLNSYRIAEAARRLVSEAGTPVLTLALDVGFRSISSFNTAFRQMHGCSPTTFRREQLSNS